MHWNECAYPGAASNILNLSGVIASLLLATSFITVGFDHIQFDVVPSQEIRHEDSAVIFYNSVVR